MTKEQTEEAEKALIGACVLEYKEALPAILEFGITADKFTGVNQILYSCICECIKRDGDVCSVNLAKEYIKYTGMPSVSTYRLIDECIDLCFTTKKARAYARIVREGYIDRSFKAMVDKVRLMDSDEGIPFVESELRKITMIGSSLPDKSAQIDELRDWIIGARSGEVVNGLPSRFEPIQKAGGYNDYTVLAARPACGKSTLMCNDATFLAQRGYKVGIMSLEMTASQLYMRILSDISNVSSFGLSKGGTSDGNYNRALDYVEKLRELNIFVDDSPHTISSLCASIMYMVHVHGVEMVFIDYLQRITIDEKGMNDNSRVTLWTNLLCALRKELKIQMCVLSQFSRLAEGVRPELSHLRDSGSIEQDAAMAIFLSRIGAEKEQKLVCCEIAKNRHGPTGAAYLRSDFKYCRFDDKPVDMEVIS